MKRPLVNKRPIGPLVNLGSQYSTDSKFDDDSCKVYKNITTSPEFFIQPEHAEPVAWIQEDENRQERIMEIISNIDLQKDEYIGVHSTSVTNAKSIMESGFSGSNDLTVLDRGIRDGAVFTWHYIWDINKGINEDNKASVIVKAPRSHVYVAEMFASVRYTYEEYIENHVMKYPQYLKCLDSEGPNGPLMVASGIIQDVDVEVKKYKIADNKFVGFDDIQGDNT
jgi:hypothetical protein